MGGFTCLVRSTCLVVRKGKVSAALHPHAMLMSCTLAGNAAGSPLCLCPSPVGALPHTSPHTRTPRPCCAPAVRKGTQRLGGTGAGAAANKALAQNVAAEKVQMYGQAFEKIQAATGIEEIDELVGSFISAEDHNYTLFNYVNEVNTEVEKLEDQTAVIRAEIGRYQDGGADVERTKVGRRVHGMA